MLTIITNILGDTLGKEQNFPFSTGKKNYPNFKMYAPILSDRIWKYMEYPIGIDWVFLEQ